MCADQSPWAVNSTLAYGFAAVNIAGGSESSWCSACYALKFTSGNAKGKTLIVQATNTGGDLGSNQFDLAIPGGGVGIFNGCTQEWGELVFDHEISIKGLIIFQVRQQMDGVHNTAVSPLQPIAPHSHLNYNLAVTGASTGSAARITQPWTLSKLLARLRFSQKLDLRERMMLTCQMWLVLCLVVSLLLLLLLPFRLARLLLLSLLPPPALRPPHQLLLPMVLQLSPPRLLHHQHHLHPSQQSNHPPLLHHQTLWPLSSRP